MLDKMGYKEVREFAHTHSSRFGSNEKLWSRTLEIQMEVFAAVSTYDYGNIEMNVKWFYVCPDNDESVRFYGQDDIEELDLITYAEHKIELFDFGITTARLDQAYEQEGFAKVMELLESEC